MSQPRFFCFPIITRLQYQLALGFCGVALLMMLAMSGLLLYKQQNFLHDAGIRRATALATSLAHSGVSWVLANDLAGLQEVVDGFADTPNQERIFILNLQGQVLASTQANEIGHFANDPLSRDLLQRPPASYVLFTSHNGMDVAAPIMVDRRLVGWAWVELNQNDIKSNLEEAALTQLGFMFLTSIVMLAVSVWLGRRMSSRLLELGNLTRSIAAGERAVRAVTNPNDEIGQLADSVNHMLDALNRSERDLEQLNRIYAAWTECVLTVAKERLEPQLLNHLCEILARIIGFRLVFIAFIESDNAWLKLAASSNWDVAYLKQLKISVYADRPEAQGPAGKCIHSGRPEIANDFLGNAELSLWHAAASSESIRSAAGFPLLRGSLIVGTVVVYSDQINYFNQEIIRLLTGISADISSALDDIEAEQHRQQNEIELKLAASVFENSQEGIMITDAEHRIIRINSTFTQLTGFRESEVLGKSPELLDSGLQDSTFYQQIWQQITQHGFWQGELINRRQTGETFVEWLCITQVTADDGRITHYVCSFSDITDRKLNEERIHRLAFYDPLTQLPNRRLLIERLRQALLDSQRSHQYGAVFFIDLDRFKILNDSQGHAYGDQLLVEVSKRISECVREQDTVSRLGGDEFVVMLEQLGSGLDGALVNGRRIGDKLLQALREPYQLTHYDKHSHKHAITHHCSASIGMTLFCGSENTCEDLLKQADVAMYQAKHEGRNKMSAFNPEMQAQILERADLEAELRQGLANRQFSLHYQPQVDKNGLLIGAEVLLRWRHPRRGAISPAEFIPLAEELDLIDELGYWVLCEACATLECWRQSSKTQALSLSVNVSAKQFSQANFVKRIETLLQTSQVDSKLLKLEVTESLVLGNVEETIAIMQKLQKIGIHFSMDDFGTGYSSLAYLQRLPLAQLKIDQSFVRNLTTDSNAAAIIRTILLLSQSLGLDVVAEGVETEDQHRYLLANGCQYFQGYLFGKPMPISDFEALIDKQAA